MRWLPAAKAPPRDEAARWFGLPPGAAGALVFVWRPPGETNTADPRAVTVLAVSAKGERLPAWPGGPKIRDVGSRVGTVFEAREAPKPALNAGFPVHVAEGEADALALALALAPGSGPVVIHADGEPSGRDAALAASEAIRGAGRKARIEWYAAGTDPADALAEWVDG